MQKIKIGISACLLGEKVRYDGGHKRDRFLTDTLGKYVEYVPVCPEVECGLGVPRNTMHLEGNPSSPRLVITENGQDVTEQIMNWSLKRLAQLKKENIKGFIFKSNSPSCGIDNIMIFNKKLIGIAKGAGIFASMFIKYFRLLPVEDEKSLHDSYPHKKITDQKSRTEHDKFNLDSNLSAVLRRFKIERTY